ncbi:MAG: hypothetical protein CMQ20_10575 [Gammaproteobacteria bacterium]|jgi:ABC-2 type transport system permease protein|nr:hypothetical protein [Gammaproteobacteria bacterium]|tara:strand:+ start:581 stop:1510 length:930 start_codon:yes stop_codon:yes gene_type:complete
MKQFPILLKREFWENRNTFVVLPCVTAGFMILLMIGVYLAVDIVGIKANIQIGGDEQHQEMSSDKTRVNEAFGYMFSRLASLPPEAREHTIYQILNGLAGPLLVILWAVVLFYLIGSLYEDRKDRSILFWKSMPVSDTSTVLSKLVSALIVVPAVYLVCVLFIQLVFLIVSSLAAFSQEASIWEVLWEPSNLLSRWFTLIAHLLFQVIWSLPLYGWVILVSAWASSVPLAWIIGAPIVFAVLERFISGDTRVSGWFTDHISPVAFAQDQELYLADLLPKLMSIDTLAGLLVGLSFVAVAVWLRSKGDEI